MAEREVLFKMTVKGGPESAKSIEQPGTAAERTAKQMDGLTAAERRLEQQQRQLSQSMGGGIGSGSNPGAAAQQMFASQQTAQQRANPGGVGLPGSFKAFLGLSAASAAARGAGEGIKNIASSDGSASLGQVFGQVTGKMLEGIPIIGGLFTGLAEFANALNGATSAIEANKRALETSSRMIGTQRQIDDARLSAGQAIISAGSAGSDAASSAAAQAAAMGRLPGSLASFRPADIFGNQNTGLGSANLGVFNAQTALDIAERQAANRQSELAQTQASFNPSLDARIAGQRQTATAAQGSVGTAKSAVDQQEWIIHKSTKDVALSDAQANASQQQLELDKLLSSQIAEQTRLKERQQAVDQANVRVAQAQLDLAKQQLEVERSKLTAKDEQIGRSKSGAVAFGMGGPGESDSLLATVRQLQQSGFGSLSQEQKGQLAGNPLTAGLAQQQAQQAGMNDPNFAAVRGLVGQISPQFALPDLAILEREREQMADALVMRLAESERKFSEQSVKIFGDGFEKIAGAITKAFEAEAEKIANLVLSRINAGLVQGRP